MASPEVDRSSLAKVPVEKVMSDLGIEPNHCDTCEYWTRENEHHMRDTNEGQCRRYPRIIMKRHDEWCGEYK